MSAVNCEEYSGCAFRGTSLQLHVPIVRRADFFALVLQRRAESRTTRTWAQLARMGDQAWPNRPDSA